METPQRVSPASPLAGSFETFKDTRSPNTIVSRRWPRHWGEGRTNRGRGALGIGPAAGLDRPGWVLFPGPSPPDPLDIVHNRAYCS